MSCVPTLVFLIFLYIDVTGASSAAVSVSTLMEVPVQSGCGGLVILVPLRPSSAIIPYFDILTLTHISDSEHHCS